MCWAPSICVMGPQSSTNIPLHCPGNQYSQVPHCGRAGENGPYTILSVLYPCLLHLYLWFSDLCLCTCTSTRLCLYYTSTPMQILPFHDHVRILQCPDCHIGTKVTCRQSGDCFFLLPFLITLLAFSQEAPYPYCHLLARHAY